MPLSKYAFSLKKRQEQFSIAFVRSISSVAGYKVVQVDVIDEDSVDFQIEQKRGVEGQPYHPVLRVQAKCTYYHKPKEDGCLHFRLSAKNYDDLRMKTGMPFILAVDRTTKVLIPTSQRLNVNGLVNIMDTLAEGEFPK